MKNSKEQPFMLVACAENGSILFADQRLPQPTFRQGACIRDILGYHLLENRLFHTDYGFFFGIKVDTLKFGYIGIFFQAEALQEAAMAAILETNKELEAIFESSHDGIVVADNMGRLIRINGSYERISGIPKGEILGMSMQMLVDKGIVSSSATLKVLNSGQPVTVSQTFQTGRQSIITGSPIYDDEHNIFRVITNVRDMTEINHLREELNLSRKKLDQYSKIVQTLTEEQLQDEQMMFTSNSIQAVCKAAIKFAKVDAPILITGESGVGKEVIADLIYKHSQRNAAPFLKINCGAIPEALLESELFGYEGGAFSGAKKEGKAGLLELAHNGTVMLDEIGELSLALQVKLLRFVQQHEFYRVGGKNLVKVDVRVIAATNRDLEQMVAEKQFRSDLYYRLNVLTIKIPPLRERDEDIVPLANFFLERFNAKYKTNKKLMPEVYRVFTEYKWPGNVREMENLIERFVVVSDKEQITVAYLPERMLACSSGASENNEAQSYQQAKAQWEKNFLEQAIQKYKSSRKVAQHLNLDHSTVVKKAAKYGIKLLARRGE